MTDSQAPPRRAQRIAAAAGFALLALVLAAAAAVLMVGTFNQNLQEGGATGIGAMLLAAVVLAAAWPCLWFAAQLVGGPGWLVRRGRFTTVMVVLGAMVVPTGAVLAGTWRFDAQEARAGEACSDDNVALLEQIDPDSALSEAAVPDGDTCGRSVWVGGSTDALLKIFDGEVTAEGWKRSGALQAPVKYTKGGQELVVDVVRTADGKAALPADGGTDGWVYLR